MTNIQGSAINLEEIKRFEVTEVYSHPDAKVDIGKLILALCFAKYRS